MKTLIRRLKMRFLIRNVTNRLDTVLVAQPTKRCPMWLFDLTLILGVSAAVILWILNTAVIIDLIKLL